METTEAAWAEVAGAETENYAVVYIYPSYNVAKTVLEFSSSIPRTQLQPGYGDGFFGAPLKTVKPSSIPFSRDQGEHCHDQSRTEEAEGSEAAGGARHV